MKRIVLTLLILAFTFNTTNAWLGLIAENGDLLNIGKWNEMITKLNTKIDQSNVTGTGNIEVNNSGTGVVISFSGGIESSPTPYITTTTQISIGSNYTGNIEIDGYNFTPNSVLQIPGFDGTVNSTTVSSPVKLQANITSGSATADYNIVISNGGVLSSNWIGNGVNLLHVGEVLGNGPAGTYTEDFESNSLGNWTTVSGLTANVSFQVDSSGTPSSSTGPSSGAGGSTYYIYPETSSPNYPDKTFAIETDYFNHAQSISFDYHMFGATIGITTVQTFYDGIWTDVWSISGQQQTAQANAYINTGNINLTGYQVEKIRIFYTSGTNYTGDAAIDNIVINSN